jgi:cellulose 1,4-beta-cellobiosidase
MVNKQFTLDIDTSIVPCEVNGELCFSETDADGGMTRFPDNKAGSKYDTGYCDAQYPQRRQIHWKQCEHWSEVRKLLL